MKRIIRYLLRMLKKNFLGKDCPIPKDFVTYHRRPKNADAIGAYDSESFPNVGIVMQGPLKYEENFTLETIKLYSKYYPDTPIIVSTWDTEDQYVLEQIQKCSANVKLCVSHFEPGMERIPINLQRTTSLTGVKKVQEMGCQYILKTRTDQRIYAPRIFSFLIKLLTTFPIKIRTRAKGRIIVCSMCTFSDRLYNLCDMFIFGYSQDILQYFSCPEDTRIHATLKAPNIDDHVQRCVEYSKLRPGEIWLATHYIESLGFDLKWTHEDSDYYRRELFIIVDDSMLDLYWPKYTDKEYRWRNYYTKDAYHQVTFREWLSGQQ